MRNSPPISRQLKLPALSLILLFVTACATSGDALGNAREALRAKDYERAVVFFDAAKRNGSLDYLTQQESDLAMRRAVDGRLERARAAEYQGDFAGALAELRSANEFAPGNGRIEQERQRITREEGRVQKDLDRARTLMSQGRAREAHKILEPLGGKGRMSGDFDTMLRSSESAAERQVAAARERERLDRIEVSVSAAELAWRRGNHGAALAAIDRGRRELGDDPAFAKRARPWRDAVRTYLLHRAAKEDGAGRFASALLLARAALTADPEHRDAVAGVERYELAARPALTQRVHVTEFSDQTGGRVDPLRFQRNLVRSLSHPFTEFTVSGGDIDLGVYGSIKALEVTSSSPKTENRVHDYVVRTEQEINPAHLRAKRRMSTAEERLTDRERTYAPVKRELYELERIENVAITGTRGNRRIGPYKEAAYYRMLSDGRSREVQARRSVEAAEEEVRIANRNLTAIPYYLDRKIVGQVPYTVRTVTKTGTATGFYSVSTAGRETAGRETGGRNPSGTETIRLTVSDSSHEGLPTAGLAPDPMEIPNDVELSEMAIDDLVKRLATRISAGIDRKRLTLLEEGRTLMRSGNEPGALDRYAAFLLTTGDTLTLERATAARSVQAAFGVEVTAAGLGLTGLRIEELGTD